MKKEVNIVLKTDIDDLKDKLSESIKVMKASGKSMSNEMGAVVASVQKSFDEIATSKNTARAVKQLQNLGLKLAELGPEFAGVADEIVKKAGGIKEKVEDIAEVTNYWANGERRIMALVESVQFAASAYGVLEGATNLLGEGNEDLQKSLLKLQSAMMIVQGLEEVTMALRAESTMMLGIQTGAQKAYNAVVGQSVGAMKNFKIALATTGVGALVVGLGLLITYYDDIIESITGVTSAQRKMNDVTKEVEDGVRPQIEAMRAYSAIVNDTARSEGERVTALEELKKAGIETRDIDISTANGLKTLNDRLVENISLMRKKAQSEALNKLLAEESLKYERLKIQYAKRQAQYVGMGTDEATKKRLKSMYAEAYAADESENLLRAKKDLTYIEAEYNKVLSEQIVVQTAQNKSTKNADDKIEAEKKAIEDKKKATDAYIKSAKELRDLEAKINEDGAKAKPVSRGIGDFAQTSTGEDPLKPQREAMMTSDAELTDSEAEQQRIRIENAVKEVQAKRSTYVKEAELLKQRAQAQEEYQERMQAAAESINQQFEQSMENTAVAFGNLIGDLANGTGGLEEFTNNILTIIADFLGSMGKALIAAAIATKAFQDLLIANPVAAIGAGIAAVAASVVVRNYAEQGPKFANGGIVSGPTYGLMGEYPNANRNPEVIAPLDKLKSMLGDTSGSGGYVAETTIKGKDLALVLRRYNEGVSRG